MAGNLVKLNVGGKKFMTSLSTIMNAPPCVLQTMVQRDLDQSMPSTHDEDGYLFIDRNGDVFGAILDYLRTGELDLPVGVSPTQLKREFDFYGIEYPEPVSSTRVEFPELAVWQQRAEDFLQKHAERLDAAMRHAAVIGSDKFALIVVHHNQVVHLGVSAGTFSEPGFESTNGCTCYFQDRGLRVSAMFMRQLAEAAMIRYPGTRAVADPAKIIVEFLTRT
eukprot:TRINITY_DN2058_c0_g1_i1.p1 TRINITY_DN2058_c0_g1~~TRINITY_DN2058_c0_g1_i1.p1  ORF type:complete len:221 (+),score=15.30 TRINITY_DN2058_c0_g1_i1:135-797(+)